MSIQGIASELNMLGIKYKIVTAAKAPKPQSKKQPTIMYVGKEKCDTGTAIKWFSTTGKKSLEVAGVTAAPKRGGVVFSVGNASMTISTNDNRMSIKLAGKDMPITAVVFMDITDRLATNNETVLKYIMRRFKYWVGVMSKPAYLEKINDARRGKKTDKAAVSISSSAADEVVEYGLWTGWNVITPSGLCLKTTIGVKGTVPAKVVLLGDKYRAFDSDKPVADWRRSIHEGRTYLPLKHAGAEIKLADEDAAKESDESDSLEDVMTPGPDQVACPMACTSADVAELLEQGERDFNNFTGFKKVKAKNSYDDRLRYTGDIEGHAVELRQDNHGNVEVIFPFKLMSGEYSLHSVPVHSNGDWEALLSHIHRCFDLGY